MIGIVLEPLLESVRQALLRAQCASEPVLVAFSGGGDSTALLWALHSVAPPLGISWLAAHADHGLDAASEQRMQHAETLAAALETRMLRGRLDTDAIRSHPDGIEAGARRARYAWLLARAQAIGARFVLTGHHADDQAETVLLRLKNGSGWMGLGAMPCLGPHGDPVRVLRPFLGLRRTELAAAVAEIGLPANRDPANRDPHFARTSVRYGLLPHFQASDPAIVRRLTRLAARARAARSAVHAQLVAQLSLRWDAGAWSVDRDALANLPAAALAPALDLLAKRAGLDYPPSRGARRELSHQLLGNGPIGCDIVRGWRLEGDGRRIRLLQPRIPGPPFAYTLRVPGSTSMATTQLCIRTRQVAVAEWMFRHAPNRVALGTAFGQASHVEIRNRRAGDRIRPLGCSGHRKLKDLLIDRRVPRHQRDRLPLLVADGHIAWVPGVTLGHRFRIREGERRAWQVEMIETNDVAERDESNTPEIDANGSNVASPRNLYLP